MSKKVTSPFTDSSHRYGCGECRVRDETIGLLRHQIESLTQMNEKMQEKLLMLSGDGADRWHRLKMTEMAHLRPVATEGIVPKEDLFLEDQAADQLFADLTNSFKQ